jgi:hypothetical protein
MAKPIKVSLVLMIVRNGEERRYVDFELGTNEYGGQYDILRPETRVQLMDEVIEFLNDEYLIHEEKHYVWSTNDED